MIFAGQRADAQAVKFGHINSDELIKAMPEYDSAMAKLEKTRKDLVNALEIMQVELNNKYEKYNKESKTLTDLVRQSREQELQDLQARIQEFQANAQQQLTEQQSIHAKLPKALQQRLAMLA